MIEIWRPIKGYEGLYEVSNLGRIKSIRKTTCSFIGKILKTKVQNKGYISVCLTKNGIQSYRFVHHFVLNAFIGPKPTPKHECNHKDGIKSNNIYLNLEWLTSRDNQLHKCYVLGKDVGANSSKHYIIGKDNHTSKKYIVVSPKGEKFIVHGLKLFCEQNNLRPSSMYDVAAGTYSHHQGWKCFHE